ncbi:BZ3500_MvSof-1268-A1-R1_Chr1-3g02521 [Microbotryum saponariae]|uniref:BZ3500_MvSof-1268-A1-R1_Chr1-3g02521 protein n=1 Tax=Microbotryum saponariae TaxID=289078 RepID=A0A2X0LBY8_9BASI|nr:BZ3500_MvSof-1268-A1-R1_Chr1-3g02521 [Microbotryum saponariae]SCZ96471.1 BZ3501_MvSof-1269-A2-R1_Chr1-3g02124 [Microbotryum saponariae]
MARYGAVKADRAPPAPPAPAAVLALRKDVRMAAISQFINLFKKHVNLQFEIEASGEARRLDLEYDLAGERPNSVVPTLLGKLCNTLANDRNTNSTNWLPALRRAYSRRLTNREDNPFYRYEQGPVEPIAPAPAAAAAAADQPTSSADPSAAAAEGTPRTESMQVDAIGTTGLDPAPDTSTADTAAATADAKSDQAAKDPLSTEPATDPTNSAASAAQPIVVDRVDLSDTESATAAPVASTSALPAATDPDDDPIPLGATERRVEVGWEEVDVDTKIQAIYNVCEWHMYEPERFRRSLKASVDDDDTSWRIEPIGKDAKGNKYYLLDPWRIWIHRAVPKKRKQKGVILVEESDDDDDDVPAFKGKGKLKAKDVGVSNGTRSSLARASNGRKHSRSVSATDLASDETPSKRSRRNRTEEVWEEIPKELLQEWGVDGNELLNDDRTKREGSAVSSALTSLDDDEDATSKAGKTESKPNGEAGTETKRAVPVGETKWEDDFWVERDQIDALQGFVEWEAVSADPHKSHRTPPRLVSNRDRTDSVQTCLTLDDWTAFADKFAKSHNTHEMALHERINSVLLPRARAALTAIEKARQQEYFSMVRKRSTRIASKESEEEQRQRFAAIKEAEEAKASRASRHKVPVTEDPDAIESAYVPAVQPPQETREERLKKREEEKQAKELALEQAQIEAVAQAQRAAETESTNGAIAAVVENATPVPEVKNDAASAEQTEKERNARVEAENTAAAVSAAAESAAAEQAAKDAAAKAAKQAEAAKRKKEKKAAKEKQHAAAAAEQAAAAALLFSAAQPVYSVVAAAAAAPPLEAQDPWYFDCEICKVAGWNYDDGHTVMCCEQCDEWQHVACHVQRDLLMNKPAQQYEDERFAFYCSKCRADPRRKPRKVPAKSTLAKAAAPAQAVVASASPQQSPPLVPTPKTTNTKSTTPKVAATKQQHKTPATPAARPNAKSPLLAKANGHVPSPASAPRPAPAPKAAVAPSKAASQTPKSSSQPPRPASQPPKSASQPPKPVVGSASPATAVASPTVVASQPVAAQPAASLPAAGQPSLSYPALKALIESNPVLINQLPPQYQSHFSQLLGIPVPYPVAGAASSPKASTSGSG